MDEQTTLAELKQQVATFIAERNWQPYHTPKHLAMSISIEAAEIMEHFQWISNEESKQYMQDDQQKAQVADEMADVMIYCMSLANSCNIDLSEAIQIKLNRNQTRFPPAEQSNEPASF